MLGGSARRPRRHARSTSVDGADLPGSPAGTDPTRGSASTLDSSGEARPPAGPLSDPSARGLRSRPPSSACTSSSAVLDPHRAYDTGGSSCSPTRAAVARRDRARGQPPRAHQGGAPAGDRAALTSHERPYATLSLRGERRKRRMRCSARFGTGERPAGRRSPISRTPPTTPSWTPGSARARRPPSGRRRTGRRWRAS